jgi:hypothetical protein
MSRSNALGFLIAASTPIIALTECPTKMTGHLVAYIAQPPLSDDERAAHVKPVGKSLRAKGGEGLVGEVFSIDVRAPADEIAFVRPFRPRGTYHAGMTGDIG